MVNCSTPGRWAAAAVFNATHRAERPREIMPGRDRPVSLLACARRMRAAARMNTRGQLRAAGLVCAKKRLLAALRFLLRIGPPAPRQARCQLPCEAEGCWIRLHGQRILLLIAGRLGFAHFTEVAVDFGVDAGARHGSALGSQWLAARQVRTGLI